VTKGEAPRELHVRSERWPLNRPFRISRGVKTAAEVIVVELREGEAVGRGESVPYSRYGESTDSVMIQIESLRTALHQGLSRQQLLTVLSAGAARNAVDCALWDLEAQISDVGGAGASGSADGEPFTTALTISLDTPEAMGAAAKDVAGWPVVKVKVDAVNPAGQIRSVREACPTSTLIVDPNESWNADMLRELEPVLIEARIALIEQPLAAGSEHELDGLRSAIPLCADESCHTVEDLAGLAGRYQFINIKLDKTGGLTAALDLLDRARQLDFGIMVGCMICTSLSIAPAMRVARHARFVDLDGPLWLSSDRAGGVAIERQRLRAPQAGFWGERNAVSPWT
jgi:L-alanine-DL-glutamate epimerase-like enolase superfamily enzyme